ncbi:MAG: histone deacetylase [Saprospiraceae bacterium]|nr:histone deacetylase [Saprospiraceae bacterium]
MGIKIAYHPIYEYPLPEGHRFPMEKYGLLKEQLIYEGVFGDDHFFEPVALGEEDVLLTHTSEYWYKLLNQSLSPKEIRKIGFPMSPLLVERGRHIAHGTYECALYALSTGVALNIAGGTHHSFAGHGEGFCIFNDMAIAANILLDKNLVKKILIVDLDVHQGNGTASIFRSNKNVFTFSMHGDKNYPLHKEQSDLDIPLPDGTEDSVYHAILNQTLEPLINKVVPDIIFYQAGVDVLSTDKLGRLNLTEYGCKRRDEIVFSSAHKYLIPVIVTMGGGYSPLLKNILNAHVNTYKIAKEIYT